jgi:hypothetical protein
MTRVTPCSPARPCHQQAHCARCDRRLVDHDRRAIDASVTLRRMAWCPMFVDARHPEFWKAA